MTLHVLRDYTAAASGYFAPGGGVNYFYTPYIYNLSLFLSKTLGYSVVGQNAWDINNTNVQTFNNAATSAIATGSNGQTLPQSTVFVASTTGFPNSGVIFVSASVSTTTAATSNGLALPQSTINVASTAPFLASGTFQIVTTAGTQTVSYTGVNGLQFTGCTGGTGNMVTGNAVTSIAPQIVNYSGLTTNAFLNCTGGTGTMTAGSFTTVAALSNGATLPQAIINVAANTTANTTITAASNGASLPQATINVVSTTGFPTSGTLNVTTGAGVQTVTYTGVTALTFTGCSGGTGTMSTGGAVNNTGFFTPFATSGTIYIVSTTGVQTVTYTNPSTTIAAGSNGATLPQGTINVASTTGFPASGAITVVTSTGTQTVTYTATSGGTQFTGCTGGTGTMSTGGAVASATSFGGCTGGTGVINTTNSVTSTGGAASCSPLKITTATAVANTPPIVTTNFPHGLSNGQYATFANTTSILPNGVWPISVVAINQFIQQTVSASGFVAGTTANIYPPGMLLASGTVAGGKGASINVTGASSVYAVSIPPNVRTVQAGAAPLTGDVGRILVLKSSTYPTKNSGLFKISAINTGNSTTIIAASNAQSLPQATINVASTTGFPASGTIFVYTSTGVQTVTYTGGGGGGTTFTGCSGGTGTMSTGNTVNNFNGYNIDYRSTDTPPPDTMDWWLYEIETQASFYVNYPNNSAVSGLALSSTTNTSPIQVNTSINGHGDWKTGQVVTISGVTVNTNANGTWTITVQNPNTTSGIFTLNGSTGNGTSGATGTVTRNGYTGGDNVSFNSKIILQSPHSTGWQVRIAVEPFNITNMPNTSVSVGYGGSSGGDWPVGGMHTHLPQFLDINTGNSAPNTAITGTVIGGSNTGGTASRITMVGDDNGQAVFCYARTQGATANGVVTFGLPDNEPTPLQPSINRPFVYGGVNTGDFGGIQMRFSTTTNYGMTFRDLNPEVCAIAGWANIDGVSGTSVVYSANAGDCPFTGTTEVLPWEIWGGIATDPGLNLPFSTANGQPPMTLNQRFMGTAPYLRQGRTNFGTFTLSTDNITSFTVSTTTGTGVSPIQITTSATNSLATGQTVVISGVTGNTAANGTFIITVIDNTHFTLNGTTGNGNYIAGGTGNGTPHWLHLQNGIYLQWNGAAGLTP